MIRKGFLFNERLEGLNLSDIKKQHKTEPVDFMKVWILVSIDATHMLNGKYNQQKWSVSKVWLFHRNFQYQVGELFGIFQAISFPFYRIVNGEYFGTL